MRTIRMSGGASKRQRATRPPLAPAGSAAYSVPPDAQSFPKTASGIALAKPVHPGARFGTPLGPWQLKTE